MSDPVTVDVSDLAPGQTRDHQLTLQCPSGNGGTNTVSAIVDADATDPNAGNDEDSQSIAWN